MAYTLSGQKTVTTHGTAVLLHAGLATGLVMIKALPGNTDTVYVGNVSEDVTSSNGFPLDAGESVVMDAANLNHIWVDSDVDGEGVAWLILDVPVSA